ncbi:hypothetical protein CANMA_004156 [Candida margitis]|uniref:uncharacterized protein n=1 Tax=Candida margitis TaxID=1775924 RepID=UPI0022270115|nr:uncharacterized protein CANMA_004156 [Candida margitis]KAI5959032.1 hypothetical protein CANMA_004156 [Candida margitis]
MSDRFSPLYRRKSTSASDNDRQRSRSISSTSGSTKVYGLHRIESHSGDNSFNTSTIKHSLYNRSLNSNSSAIFKQQDADDVVDWIDSIKSRYQNLKSKQRQELHDLLQQQQEEDNKRRLKQELQSKHFDEDFAKLGKLLEQREAEEAQSVADLALLQEKAMPELRNLSNHQDDPSSHWVDNSKDGSSDVDLEVEESEELRDSLNEDESGSEEQYEYHNVEGQLKASRYDEVNDVIEISSEAEVESEGQSEIESEVELENENHDSSHPFGQHDHLNSNYNDISLFDAAQSALAYSQPSQRRIDPYDNRFSYAGEGQEQYGEEEYSEQDDHEDEQDCESRVDYQAAEEDDVYPETKGGSGSYLNTQSGEYKSHEGELDQDIDLNNKVESNYEDDMSPDSSDERFVQNAQGREEIDLQRLGSDNEQYIEDDYEQRSLEYVNSSGGSSVNSEIESNDYIGYTSREATHPRQHSASISIDARSVSPHPNSESENQASNFDSQAEGFADEEKEEDEPEYSQNVPANAYNTLQTFASRALGDRTFHNFKDTHAQSGYMADAEYTDNNLPRVTKDDDIDSDTHLDNNDFRPDELAPVPDPFYAQELSDQRMKVNDFDENRSEGSLADESQYESHRSDYHQDKQYHVGNVGRSTSFNEEQSYPQDENQVVAAPFIVEEADIQVVKNPELEYSSDENPPAPIFKSIEEEEDPETILQNLKNAEKKYNIKIDAVEDLERSIKSFSEPPDEGAERPYKLGFDMWDDEGKTQALHDDTTNAWKEIPVPVLESIDANTSAISSYDTISSNIEQSQDDMEVDEVSDNESKLGSAGTLAEEVQLNDNMDMKAEASDYNQTPQTEALIRHEEQSHMAEQSSSDAASAKLSEIGLSEDNNKATEVIPEDDEEIIESPSTKTSGYEENDAQESSIVGTPEPNSIETPVLESIHEFSSSAETSVVSDGKTIDENDGHESSDDLAGAGFEKNVSHGNVSDPSGAMQLERQEPGYSEGENEEIEITVISSDSDNEDEVVTVISSGSSGEEDSEITIISDGSSSDEEELTVIRIGSVGVEDESELSKTNDTGSENKADEMDEKEQTNSTDRENSAHAESSSASPDQNIESRFDRGGVSSWRNSYQNEPALLTDNATAEDVSQQDLGSHKSEIASTSSPVRGIDNDLVQDVINLAYSLAENEEYDNTGADFFGGREAGIDVNVGSSSGPAILGPTEKVVSKLSASDIREKLRHIFPNVGPSKSLLAYSKYSPQSENQEHLAEATVSHVEEDKGDKVNATTVLTNAAPSEHQISRVTVEDVNRLLREVFRGNHSTARNEDASCNVDEPVSGSIVDAVEEFVEEIQSGKSSDNEGSMAKEVSGVGSGADGVDGAHESKEAIPEHEPESAASPMDTNENSAGNLLQAATDFVEEMEMGETLISESNELPIVGSGRVKDLVNAASDFIEEMDEGKSDKGEGPVERDKVDNEDEERGSSASINIQLDSVNGIADAATHFVEQMDEGEISADVSASDKDPNENNVHKKVSSSVKFADFVSNRLRSFSEAIERTRESLIVEEFSSGSDEELLTNAKFEITYSRPSRRRRRRRKIRRHELPLKRNFPPLEVSEPDIVAPSPAPLLQSVAKKEVIADQSDDTDSSATPDVVVVKKEVITDQNSADYYSATSDTAVKDSPLHEDKVKREESSSDDQVNSKNVPHPIESLTDHCSDENELNLEDVIKLAVSKPSLDLTESTQTHIIRRNPSKRKSRARRRRILGLDLSEIEQFEHLESVDEGHSNDDISEAESESSRGRKRVSSIGSLRQSSVEPMEYPASRTRSKSPLKKRRKY